MFRKFFKNVITYVRKYVKKHGIAKAISNVIEGSILLSGVATIVGTAIHRWLINRKFNKMIKSQGIDRNPAKSEGLTCTDMIRRKYDENGRQLSNDEWFNLLQRELRETEVLYSNANRECVKLIETYSRETFEGMDIDQRFKYVRDHNYDPFTLRRKFEMEKESMQKSANELQAMWNQPEESKIGEASVVTKEAAANSNDDSDGILVYDVQDFRKMEKVYGCENFHYTGPGSESKLRIACRKKFADTVEVVNAYMNWVSMHNHELWKKWIKVSNNNLTSIWNCFMLSFIDHEEEFNEIKALVESKSKELEYESRGRKPSTLPKIKSLDDDVLYSRLEALLERLQDKDANVRKHAPALHNSNNVEDDDDDDEYYSDDFIYDTDEVTVSGSDDILDQLENLRNGRDPMATPTQVSQHIVTASNDIPDNTSDVDDLDDNYVIKLDPKSYTIEARANEMMKRYAKLHAEDIDAANDMLEYMLADEDGKNYAYYEVSDYMKVMRQNEFKLGLPIKYIASDYDTVEERNLVCGDRVNKIKEYGRETWLAKIDERTMHHRKKFEQRTLDTILDKLPTFDMDYQAKVDLIQGLSECDNDYTLAIRSSRSNDLYMQAINQPKRRTIKTVGNNIGIGVPTNLIEV